MSIKDTIRDNMNQARKTNDTLSRKIYSMALDAITKAEKKVLKDYTDEEVIEVLQREIKQYKETLVYAIKAENKSLIDEIEFAIKTLEQFLPQMMTEAEIENYLNNVLVDIEPIKKNRGRIMKAMSVLKGKADMKLVSEIVNRVLV